MSFGTLCPACLSIYLSVCLPACRVACSFWKKIKVCCYQCLQSDRNSYRISTNNIPHMLYSFKMLCCCDEVNSNARFANQWLPLTWKEGNQVFILQRDWEREKRLCFVTQDSLQFLFVTSSGGFAQYVQSVELLLLKADSYLISGELS
jgi:hypothetical protein